MRVALTGTPGTGKTTVSDLLAVDIDVVHLNERIEDKGLYDEVDEDRGSLVADLDAVADALADVDDVVIESHLAHYLDVDRVVVLRCHPEDLEARLRERGVNEAKAQENAESEALDVILAEAVERHGRERVYEVDTTDRDPAAVAHEVERAIGGERDPSAGEVDFTEYL